MRRSQLYWDIWFIDLAKQIATASKDPSTKVGAVIAKPSFQQDSMGFLEELKMTTGFMIAR